MGLPGTVEQSLEQVAILRNRRKVLALNDRHPGATIFILGASAQLNRLTPAQIDLLSRAPAIGLNRTQYRVPTMYFMSSYSHEVGLALRVGGADAVIQSRGSQRPLVPGTLALWKRGYEDDRGLPRRFHGERLILYNMRNAALPATHLALIMGARRIVYIGLEQRTSLHFYDEDPELRERIIADLDWVRDMRYPDPHLADATLERRQLRLRTPVEELLAQPYWHVDHTPSFRTFFAELERYGIEPIATLENSVVYDAGARLMALDEAVERFARPARRGPARPPLIARRRRHRDAAGSAAEVEDPAPDA
jgi:hypothetical protein